MWALYTANSDHWIPIQTLASFKRMKEFNPLGVEWIANALSESEYLEVDETKTKVRRLDEVKEPKGQLERSIYAVRCIILPLPCAPFSLIFFRKDLEKRSQIHRQSWKRTLASMARLTR